MKILTWNVNSIRIRQQQIIDLIKEERPDVICLQETKVNNDAFPEQIFKSKGYFSFFNGISSYNGVCIFSNSKVKNFFVHDFCKKNDARHIQISFKGINIHSLYVPAGGDKPDPQKNEKFKHKLKFLDELLVWSKKQKGKNILCGDINIAPRNDDVWSHNQLKNIVSHTEIERKKIDILMNEGGWEDVVRKFVNPPENVFTWWSYRSQDFTKNNRGRRLDHIWLKNCESLKFKNTKILSHTRKLHKPSDHVPIVCEFKL